MKHESSGSLLSTVFVDYDNIYLSLKRKNAEAAKRFAKNASMWLSAIASGELITSTNGVPLSTPRRIVMNRCYGNPVPRRNSSDNATDMNSFPFVRHHYLRAGFEVIDCPPLTAQLKNSADIRMVMDVRDYLIHDTYFDEFIILSGDADFTPVLHRLRAHARRTVIYANDYTAAPYRAISDGEIREADLMSLLMNGDVRTNSDAEIVSAKGLPSAELLTQTRTAILNEVLGAVRNANEPLPLEALADRAVRMLGHDKTVGTAWGGVGSFRDLLLGGLPKTVKLSGEAPYYVFDTAIDQSQPARVESKPAVLEALSGLNETPAPQAARQSRSAPQVLASQNTRDNEQYRQPTQPAPEPETISAPSVRTPADSLPARGVEASRQPRNDMSEYRGVAQPSPVQQSHVPEQQRPAVSQDSAHVHHPANARMPAKPAPTDNAASIQQSIARIQEACQAPPLSPPEYRVLFQAMANEIKTNGLTGARTLVNIVQAAQDLGVKIRRDDARFILEIVSEADPWFEQGASAHLFASRFRNFVVARCRGQGMNLAADELDLIDAWFSGASPHRQSQPDPARENASDAAPPAAPVQAHGAAPTDAEGQGSLGDVVPRRPASASNQDPFGGSAPLQQDDPFGQDEFPRIIRTRARG